MLLCCARTGILRQLLKTRHRACRSSDLRAKASEREQAGRAPAMGAIDELELPDGEVMKGSAEAWDQAADGYRKLSSSRSAAGLKAARVRAGEAVLDVGTGPGMNVRLPSHPHSRSHSQAH